VAFCRACGKPLCDECKRAAQGTIFCAEHAPVVAPPPSPAASAPPPPPVGFSPYRRSDSANPGLAFLLGFIPGVGAIYNGQYAKGLVHAVIFGLLVTAVSSNNMHGFEPMFGILIGVFVFYMAIEALHTARKRGSGEPIEEFSSLVNVGDSGFP